jgi:hypothetical protein
MHGRYRRRRCGSGHGEEGEEDRRGERDERSAEAEATGDGAVKVFEFVGTKVAVVWAVGEGECGSVGWMGDGGWGMGDGG